MDGKPATGLRASHGERWLVPCDSEKYRTDDQFEAWLKEQNLAGLGLLMRKLLRRAWDASRQKHTASLTHIGWLDQKERVWPVGAPLPGFTDGWDGGSFQPLLVDNRED